MSRFADKGTLNFFLMPRNSSLYSDKKVFFLPQDIFFLAQDFFL